MANFASPLLKFSCFLTRYRFVSAKRYLFSSEILGIENFKRIRIFERDRLCNKQDFINQLNSMRETSDNVQDRSYFQDLVKLIYIAENKSEVTLIISLLRKFHCNGAETLSHGASLFDANGKSQEEGPMSPGRFQTGPLVFRLLYILGDMDSVQSLFEDKILRKLFQNTTCYLLLMAMLYRSGHHQQVVEKFVSLQQGGLSAKFSPDCTTLAFAALYKLDTADSCQEMKRLTGEAQVAGNGLSRRSVLFAAALALKQGEAAFAKDIAESALVSNETVFRNIKLMALSQLGQLEETLKTMEEGLLDRDTTKLRTYILYSDTVKLLAEQFARKGTSELRAKFESVLSCVEVEGLLSPQTVEHFVNRPILRLRKPNISHSFKARIKSPLKN